MAKKSASRGISSYPYSPVPTQEGIWVIKDVRNGSILVGSFPSERKAAEAAVIHAHMARLGWVIRDGRPENAPPATEIKDLQEQCQNAMADLHEQITKLIVMLRAFEATYKDVLDLGYRKGVTSFLLIALGIGEQAF